MTTIHAAMTNSIQVTAICLRTEFDSILLLKEIPKTHISLLLKLISTNTEYKKCHIISKSYCNKEPYCESLTNTKTRPPTVDSLSYKKKAKILCFLNVKSIPIRICLMVIKTRKHSIT